MDEAELKDLASLLALFTSNDKIIGPSGPQTFMRMILINFGCRPFASSDIKSFYAHQHEGSDLSPQNTRDEM